MSKKQEQQPQQEPQAQGQKPSKNVLLQALIALFTIHRLRDHREEK